MNKNHWILLLFIVPLLFLNCKDAGKKNVKGNAIPVIFDTDMGNDIDDALALDMLYKYMDEGKINLLGIMLNKNYLHSPEYIDIMGTWYGYPDIPVGILKTGEKLHTNDENFTGRVAALTVNGKPAFERTIDDYNSLPDSYKLYRKLLSEQLDNSVTVISVGFLTNLALLLESSADEFSPLTGKELVAKKVKLLSIMAGSFTDELYAEYNILINKSAATKTFAEWSSPIVASPFELGDSIKYPGSSIKNDLSWTDLHPLVEGYRHFPREANINYNRSTWDLTSVLYAVEPDSVYFSLSPKGFITSDENGYTQLTADENGKHQYLITNSEQREAILNHFIKLISRIPNKYK